MSSTWHPKDHRFRNAFEIAFVSQGANRALHCSSVRKARVAFECERLVDQANDIGWEVAERGERRDWLRHRNAQLLLNGITAARALTREHREQCRAHRPKIGAGVYLAPTPARLFVRHERRGP